MGQIIIDIEENDNCGYFPVQVFETQGKPRSSAVITVPAVPGSDERHQVVGWCASAGAREPREPKEQGVPCEATAVVVGDSGSGQVLLIHGGEHGIRLRPVSSDSQWSLESGEQKGEPYMLITSSAELAFSD